MAHPRISFSEKNAVLQLVREIPAGRITTPVAIAEHLGLSPRHVAFILAQLSETERLRLPWHRVVGPAGKIADAGLARGQVLKLAEDGINVDRHDHVVDFHNRLALPKEFARQTTCPHLEGEEFAWA